MKKITALMLATLLCLTLCVPAFAADAETAGEKSDEAISAEELIDHLNSVDFGKDITFTILPQSELNGQDLLKFDSVADAEAYLKELVSETTRLARSLETSMHGGGICKVKIDAQRALASGEAGWYDGTVWWWGGGNNSLLGWTNAVVRFYYNGAGTMSNITVTDSYMTGIVGAVWTHRRGSATHEEGMDAKYSVTGTWLIGVNIYDFPVGFSFDETLNSPTITMEIN